MDNVVIGQQYQYWHWRTKKYHQVIAVSTRLGKKFVVQGGYELVPQPHGDMVEVMEDGVKGLILFKHLLEV